LSRGRGQPPKIGPERYGELLGYLATGLSMPATAKKLGVTRATLYNLAERDEQMGAAMQRARAAAKSVHTPSESCYVNSQCRTPECTAAATEARLRRRNATAVPVTPLQRVPCDVLVGGQRVNVYALLDDGNTPLADTA
jgi:DNA-binding XRE family transcriptional regulator